MFEDRVARPLLALHRILGSLSIPWYIFGAQAAVLWGQPRMSLDLDITIHTPLDALPRLLSTFDSEADIRLRTKHPHQVVHRSRLLPLFYIPNQLPIDMVFGGPGLDQALARARE